MLTRFAQVAGVSVAGLVIWQLHHTIDDTHSRFTDTQVRGVTAGPYDLRIPAGWRDARELAIPEFRAHVARAHSDAVLVPEGAPLSKAIEIAWLPASGCEATIHVAGEPACIGVFDDGHTEQVSIQHGDRELVLRGDVGAIDEVLASVKLRGVIAPAPAAERPSV